MPTPQAIRAAAERIRRDTLVVYENQAREMTAAELAALSLTRHVCAEIIDGDRPVA